MKKILIISGLVLLLIVSIVSAGLLSDAKNYYDNKVTGKVTTTNKLNKQTVAIPICPKSDATVCDPSQCIKCRRNSACYCDAISRICKPCRKAVLEVPSQPTMTAPVGPSCIFVEVPYTYSFAQIRQSVDATNICKEIAGSEYMCGAVGEVRSREYYTDNGCRNIKFLYQSTRLRDFSNCGSFKWHDTMESISCQETTLGYEYESVSWNAVLCCK